jgi:hypothetical protein
MYHDIYIRRRDGGEFDVPELERWVSRLPGAFQRTNRPNDLFIIADDEKDREKWMPLYAADPYRYGTGTSIRIDKNQIWIQLGGGDKANDQVRRFVARLLEKYDCVISDATTDITAEIRSNLNALF